VRLAVLAFALAACASPKDGPMLNQVEGLALAGYDPVSYFPAGGGKPLPGRSGLEAAQGGLVYRFATEENREAFKKNPERYAPAYGGWCAWAMAAGETSPVDPESFLIQDGRLLLFYAGFLADDRAQWLAGNPVALKAAADRNWRALVGEEPEVELGPEGQ
jgi:YHS domain-containing protein